MFKVIKKTGKIVNAYRLGEKSDVIDKFVQRGEIKEVSEGVFEVFSREAVNGKGEIAYKGDFIKIDSDGFPYPNDKAFFAANHRWIEDSCYEQIPNPLDAWTAQEPMCDEVDFLIKNKGLIINENDTERYFSAEIWGAVLSAAKDAVIVFYSINRDNEGNVADADFNFVCRSEFEKSYVVL